MSSTYLSLHYHLVFGTKSREPLIALEWRPRLHDYLGGTIRGLGGFPERVGGVDDHVHLLVGLKATHCLADVLRELKMPGAELMEEGAEEPRLDAAAGEAECRIKKGLHIGSGTPKLERVLVCS